MKWDMEIEEIETVLEKIWDLHDKLSDAILSISRAHYLNCVKSRRKSGEFPLDSNKKPFSNANNGPIGDENRGNGFVYVKGFRADDDVADYSAIQEARSLNSIRTALENLEDQLEFLHTVHVQQRAERDAAIARLEQSRIILAMRLAEHQGKKYKVIEEALAFVGDVQDTSQFVSPDNLYGSVMHPPAENSVPHEGKRSSGLLNILITSFNFAKESLKLDQLGGILGNAALVALSMLALLHLNERACRDKYIVDLPQKQEDAMFDKNLRRVSRPESSSSSGHLTHFDVMSARG